MICSQKHREHETCQPGRRGHSNNTRKNGRPFLVSDSARVDVLVGVGDLVDGADVNPSLVGERADAGVGGPGRGGHVELKENENSQEKNQNLAGSELY